MNEYKISATLIDWLLDDGKLYTEEEVECILREEQRQAKREGRDVRIRLDDFEPSSKINDALVKHLIEALKQNKRL